VITEQDIRAQLQIRIQRDGLLAAAQYLKVCPPYLVRIAQGKDPVSKKLARRLGYRKVAVFVEAEGSA
jgi:hypothetical protein